jgi:flagellar biosynthesis protein FlhF
MQVRRFRADSIQVATSMVRKALGSDALILSTRRLGDGLAKSGRDSFEIWAVPNDPYGDSGKSTGVQEPSLNALQSELTRIKDMLFLLGRDSRTIERLFANPCAMDLYTRLVKGGICERYAHSFLERGGVFEDGQMFSPRTLHKRVFEEILNTIEVTDPFGPGGQRQIVAAFVGSTGVGKTTTIAKLAADLSLKKKKRVGLISIDNFRVGATEQLKTYAAILGVPCFPAFNGTDLGFALRRMKEKDVILIDTAGQSQYDTTRLEELAGLIGSEKAIRCHLLLNTAINEMEMQSAAKNFGRLRPVSYIFTKTDETRARGAIINQIVKTKMPVSFITTGQRVPEDILKATKTGILSLVFQ